MLRSLALTAAAIVPATAMGATSNTHRPDDAELVALADEYQVVNSENGTVLQRIARLRPLWKAEIVRRGIVLGNDGQGLDALSTLEHDIGFTPLQDQNEQLADRMSAIEERSAELHATSVQGLRAKLLIAYLSQGPKMSVGPVHEHQDWHVQLFNHVFADLDQMAATIMPSAPIMVAPAMVAVSELAAVGRLPT